MGTSAQRAQGIDAPRAVNVWFERGKLLVALDEDLSIQGLLEGSPAVLQKPAILQARGALPAGSPAGLQTPGWLEGLTGFSELGNHFTCMHDFTSY